MKLDQTLGFNISLKAKTPCSAIYQLLGLIFLVMLSLPVYGQDPVEEKVLFVGNSYTYFWNLPQTVAAMSQNTNHRLITRQSTEGGVNLGQHWRSDKDLRTREFLETMDFDIVILQDHSMRAIKHPDSLQVYGRRFGELIKEKGAKVYLYMTWARSWDPYMIDQIAKEYQKLAEDIDAELVPVGMAWDLSRKMRPDLDLYDVDDTHPSPEGTYLSACVFYGALTGKSPVGLPERIVTEDAEGEKLYLNIQSKENALFLQKTAAYVLGDKIKSH